MGLDTTKETNPHHNGRAIFSNGWMPLRITETGQSICGEFKRYFVISLIEHDYIIFRLNRHGWSFLSRIFQLPLIRPLGCHLFRRLAGLVILARKGEHPDRSLMTGKRQEVFGSIASSPAQVKNFQDLPFKHDSKNGYLLRGIFMCGISGFLDTSNRFGNHELQDIVLKMVDTLHHRGPDDSGAWADAKPESH